jgi:catalase
VSPTAIVRLSDGTELPADRTALTAPSVIYDGVFVPGGAASVATLQEDSDVLDFVAEAFKHSKTLGATGEGVDLLLAAIPPARLSVANASNADASGRGGRAASGRSSGAGDPEVTLAAMDGIAAGRDGGSVDNTAEAFITALAQHRHFTREPGLQSSRAPTPRSTPDAPPQKAPKAPRSRRT